MWADGRAVDFLSSGLGHMDVVARLADGRGWCVCVWRSSACGGSRGVRCDLVARVGSARGLVVSILCCSAVGAPNRARWC